MIKIIFKEVNIFKIQGVAIKRRGLNNRIFLFIYLFTSFPLNIFYNKPVKFYGTKYRKNGGYPNNGIVFYIKNFFTDR